eukprot:2224917-Pyramimonas_sp.AAC.1
MPLRASWIVRASQRRSRNERRKAVGVPGAPSFGRFGRETSDGQPSCTVSSMTIPWSGFTEKVAQRLWLGDA